MRGIPCASNHFHNCRCIPTALKNFQRACLFFCFPSFLALPFLLLEVGRKERKGMEGRMRRYGLKTSPERTKVWTEPTPRHQVQQPQQKQQQHHHHHHHQQHRLQQSPPQQQQQGKKVPVVYYLCKNRHLEHPHFIEVPLSSPEGLYLRDVIIRLNVLRGKGMTAMYSWSCKRSYKNGFVWHDLAEDDLILPAQGIEYVLKGSELLEQSPSDRHHHGLSNAKIQNPRQSQQHSPASYNPQEASSYSSSAAVIIKESKLPQSSPQSLPHSQLPPPLAVQEDELSPVIRQSGSSVNCSPETGDRTAPSSAVGSPSSSENRVFKIPAAQDASTQTEDRRGRKACGLDTRIVGVSTDDGPSDTVYRESQRNQKPCTKEPEINVEQWSPPPTLSSASSLCAKTSTLESLIRDEISKRNSFRIVGEEEVFAPTREKLKATNMLMQLISCGSISVKDPCSFGFVPAYRPRFTNAKFPSPLFSNSMVLGEIDCLSESKRMMGLRVEDEDYFTESLIYPKMSEEIRNCKLPDPRRDKEKGADTAYSKCLSGTMKVVSCKHSRNDMNETMVSPTSDTRNSSAGPASCRSSPLSSSKIGSKRIMDSSSAKGSSMRLESFREEKAKVIKNEENLLLELGR